MLFIQAWLRPIWPLKPTRGHAVAVGFQRVHDAVPDILACSSVGWRATVDEDGHRSFAVPL